MNAARHTSVSASKTYQRVGHSSEFNKFKALDPCVKAPSPSPFPPSSNFSENHYPSATSPPNPSSNLSNHQLLESKWEYDRKYNKVSNKQQSPSLPFTSNHLPHHALEMQTLPRTPIPNTSINISIPTSPWSFQSHDPTIERYPSSLFSTAELEHKRKMNLVAVDESGNEFVYIRKV